MKNMCKKIQMLLLLFSILFFYSQNCKVLINTISESYKGKCLNGLAEGKGEGKGEDKYIGVFHEGLPEGKGKYIYKNGNTFEGNFKMGKKEGKGIFTFLIGDNKMVQKGFWVNDEYVGISDTKELISITDRTNVSDYKIEKEENQNNKIRISIIETNLIFVPRKFEIDFNSGTKFLESKYIDVVNFSLPFHCEIRYSIFTSGGEKLCRFSFDITKSGNYQLQIIN